MKIPQVVSLVFLFSLSQSLCWNCCVCFSYRFWDIYLVLWTGIATASLRVLVFFQTSSWHWGRQNFLGQDREDTTSRSSLSSWMLCRQQPALRIRALALSVLLHASNFCWSSVLHMVIYMFQCYSLISSHPRLLPYRPKVFSLYLCLFCCLAYRVVIPIFLNSIYMH